MKKFYNHPVFLQILCVILIMFLGKSLYDTKNYKALVTEVLRNSLSAGVESLQKNNAALLGASMNGIMKEDLELAFEGLDTLIFNEDEIGAVLGIQHRPFDWMDLKFIEWSIRDLSYKDSLSKKDIAFIKDVRVVNEALIDAYYEIIEAEGVSFRIGYSDKKRVIDIYKSWINRAQIIAETDAYQNMCDFETDEESGSIVDDAYTMEQARVVALDFIKKVTGKVFELEEDENPLSFVFEVLNTDVNNENCYVVTVNKNKGLLSAYLSYKLGNGAFDAKLIDASAVNYMDLLVPENYVLYDRSLNYSDNELESIKYALVYYNGQYYDNTQRIEMCIDTKGRLDDYSQTYNDVELNMPKLIAPTDLLSKIADEGIEKVLLVRKEDTSWVYWVYIQSNGALYTAEYDAVTGNQSVIYSESSLYYNRVDLE